MATTTSLPSDMGSSSTLPPPSPTATTPLPSDMGSSSSLPPSSPMATSLPADMGSSSTLPPPSPMATSLPSDMGSSSSLPPPSPMATSLPADMGSSPPEQKPSPPMATSLRADMGSPPPPPPPPPEQAPSPSKASTPPSRRLPDFLQSVNLKYVKLGYHYLITHLLTLLLLPIIATLLLHSLQSPHRDDLLRLYLSHLRYNLLSILLCSSLAIFALTLYLLTRPRPIYLLDFSCHLPPAHLHASTHQFTRHSLLSDAFSLQSLEFQRKVLLRSGLGEQTAVPSAMHAIPPAPSLLAARQEAEDVIFSALDHLFSSTSVKPKHVGILVVNCSLFNPTPSLSSIIVNRYKLRGNIRSFNLGGMGCSAGVIAVDLARELLQVHRNTLALVVSTENITQNWYFGNKKSMLIPNCLFRVGGSAVLLSNRSSDRRKAKYKLLHVVRTHKGADDKAFQCVYQDADDEGKVGVSLSRDLMAIAGDALKTNITTLGPLVLPMSEQLLFFATLVARKLFPKSRLKPYIPDFKLAFDHFCIHAGGRAVIDELEKNLQLSPDHVEASRMTLHRFGNTSSSSIWYELAYTEAKGRVRKAHRVWQIAFGSGFKCNSAVWVALRDLRPTSGSNPWENCIHRYPVHLVDGASPADG